VQEVSTGIGVGSNVNISSLTPPSTDGFEEVEVRRIINLTSMPKAKLGSGARFKSLTKKLAKKGATNPKALAAYIGRKKYGNAKMSRLAAKGRKVSPRST
jgi:hypothetical protein